jgi:CrcB protein
MCRFLIWKASFSYSVFPLGTLIANSLSCVVLGIMVGWLNLKAIDDRWSLLVVTGFCGGFSTYSTFTFETLQLLKKEDYLMAGINIFGNLLLCIISILVGMKLISWLLPR